VKDPTTTACMHNIRIYPIPSAGWAHWGQALGKLSVSGPKPRCRPETNGALVLVPSLAAWHYGMAFVVLAGFRAALGSMVGSRLPMQSRLCEVA
jgi:hypothetical protein